MLPVLNHLSTNFLSIIITVLLHHMFSDKQCEGTRDWHVEAYATGDALGTASPIRSLCKPTYTNCDLTAFKATPVQAGNGYIW